MAQALLVAVLVTAALSFILSANLLPHPTQLQEGDVAPVSLRAPRKVAYVSQVRTRQARDQAAGQVQPVLALNQTLIAQERRAQSDLLQQIAGLRAASTTPPDQRATSISALTTTPIDPGVAARIVALDDPGWRAVSAEAQRVLQDTLANRIPADALDQADETMPLRVSPTFSDADRAVVVDLTSRFVQPNLVENQTATAQARQTAEDAVAPIQVTYERGQIVVRDGQVIGPLEFEALESLGLSNGTIDWASVAAATLFSAALVSFLAAYVWHFDRVLIVRERRLVLLVTLVLVAALAEKLVVPGRPLWAYVFPLPAVSMVIAILLDARLGIVVGAMLALLLAWIAGGSLDIGVIAIVGVAAGALAVWKRERVAGYFLAGLYVALAQMIAYGAFFLASRSFDWAEMSVVLFELAANGLLSAVLTVGSYALLGRLFGIMTTMSLLELANPTQPVLRRLLMEAPGTYHHSIMAGNLAERAAEVIGADSLLVRVAAYYHDIGKLERPWAFIENQADPTQNVHDQMTPEDSARIIAAHVTDGVKLAQQAGLPGWIAEIIPQHHGTRTISFFYQQACATHAEPPSKEAFSYQGPVPQSREAALLMLADSTEAAARAARDHSREAIEALVEHIVLERVEDGQFDECNLTLRDLTLVKQSFVTLLTGIYHPRIPYPPRMAEEEITPVGPMPLLERPQHAMIEGDAIG